MRPPLVAGLWLLLLIATSPLAATSDPSTRPLLLEIAPNPIQASTAYQHITLRGNNFTPDITLDIRWSGGGTLLSERITFIDKNTLLIKVRTGKEDDRWQLQLISPSHGNSNALSLTVLKDINSQPPAAGEPASSILLRGEASRQSNLLPHEGLLLPQSTIASEVVQYKHLEPPLWELLGQGKISALKAEIQRLQQLNPQWQPPAKLLVELNAAQRGVLIPQAIKQQQWHTLIRLAKEYPAEFGCSRRYNRLQLATAYHQQGYQKDRNALYRRSLHQCQQPQLWLETLYHAQEHLDSPAFGQLLLELPIETTRDPQVATLRYDLLLAAAATAANAGEFHRAQEILTSVAGTVLARSDVEAGRLTAWVHQSLNETTEAHLWLQRVSRWSNTPEQGLKLAWSYYQQGDYDRALELAREGEQQSAEQCHAIDTFATALAGSAFEAQRYGVVLALLDEIMQCDAALVTPDHQSLRAWSHFHLQQFEPAITIAEPAAAAGNDYCTILTNVRLQQASSAFEEQHYQQALQALQRYPQCPAEPSQQLALSGWSRLQLAQTQQAADDFAALYRLDPSPAATDGVMISHYRLGAIAAIDQLASAQGGPLRERLPPQLGAALQDPDSKFTLTEKLSLVLRPPLAPPEPGYTLAAYQRNHSGQMGTRRLSEWRFPMLQGRFGVGNRGGVTATIEQVDIDSGPYKGTLFGAPPTRHLENGLETTLRYDQVADRPWFIILGHTPTEGVINPTWRGALGIRDHGEHLGGELRLFRRLVRETLLSTTGIEEQQKFAGEAWGRVVENGIGLSGYRQLSTTWQLSAGLEYAQLRGVAVADNSMYSLVADLSRSFDIAPDTLAPLRAGLYLQTMSYDRNLSLFTPGHGGYFSPSRLVDIGIKGEIHSPEHKKRLGLIRYQLGVQDVVVDSAYTPPPLPYSFESADYGASHGRAIAGMVEIAGIKRLDPKGLQLGARFRYQQSRGYDETIAGLFIRYLPNRRNRVRLSDIYALTPPYLPQE